MNILFLTPRDSGKNLGGVEGHVRLLTGELERRGHQVEELSLSEVGAPVVRSPLPWSTSTRRGVATTGFGRSGDILSQAPKYRDRPKMLWKIEAWAMLWKNKGFFKWADIIHVHDVFWWYFPFWVINKGLALLLQQGQALETRIFVTFHGWEGVCPPTLSAVIQKRTAALLSDGTIGVGTFFEKWYGVKMDKIVWGVIGGSLTNRQIDKSSNRQIKTLAITFLGRLEEVNGIEILLEALGKLINRQIDKYTNRQIGKLNAPRCNLFRFVFVGEGSYRKQAEKFGLVTGMVKNPQKYLIDADVVITSSYMSMLEAAAMGKKIISIANNPLKMDYLESHPLRRWITKVRNAEELAKIIRGLYKGPALREQQGRALKDIESARLWALKQTPEKLAGEYEKLWGEKWE